MNKNEIGEIEDIIGMLGDIEEHDGGYAEECRPNEELYDRFVFILENEFKDISGGEVMDTLKLLMHQVIGCGMKEEHEYYAEKHREALK